MTEPVSKAKAITALGSVGGGGALGAVGAVFLMFIQPLENRVAADTKEAQVERDQLMERLRRAENEVVVLKTELHGGESAREWISEQEAIDE